MISRLRRLWAQLRDPMRSYDPLTDSFLVPVAGVFVDHAGKWSEPVQIRVVRRERPGPFGGDIDLEIRVVRNLADAITEAEVDRTIERILRDSNE